MKLLARAVSFVILASAVVLMSNCGGDDPKKSAQEIQLGKLSKTWILVSASLNTVTEPPQQILSNFSLTFSGTFNANSPDGPYNFSVTGTQFPSPWPPSGTWRFAGIGSGDSGTLFRITDDMPITYSIDSTGKLTLTFTCPAGGCEFPGARTEQVVGVWTFVLE